MSDQSTKEAETVALKLVEVLADLEGVPWVADILDIIEGKSTDETLEDLSMLGRAVLQGVLGVLEPATVRAALQAGYVAANAAGDAALNAKFSKP